MPDAVNGVRAVRRNRASYLRPATVGLAVGLSALAMLFPAAASATISEFPVSTASSIPSGITAGPDGNLWFTEANASRIGRITPTGVVTEFPTTTAFSGVGSIAAGPDGNLWFTESSGNQIGRITPGGAVTEFAIPTDTSFPAGIAAGPDGNLWFAESNGNQIGRITPTGAISEFPIPTTASRPTQIAAGPDGNLWFTEFPKNKIGRITPTGMVSEFAIPTANSNPQGITAGPDGNLWFTEADQNKIGRITPTGVVSEFAIPTASSHPIGIAPGRDGNLWFTEANGNKIGRITPAGVVSGEFAVATARSTPSGIAAGPDGNLWFTESGIRADRIGRVDVEGPLAVTGAASAITDVSATVGGSVDPRGASLPTSYHFEYGPTSAYGHSTPVGSLPSGAAREVSADLSGLTPGTKYHYRLVAENATGISAGEDQVFPKDPPPTNPAPTSAPTSASTPVKPRPSILLPSVTGYGLTNNPFVVGGGKTPTFGSAAVKKHKTGTTFRYTLSEAATVKIVIGQRRSGRRKGKRCVAPTRKLRKAGKCVRLTTRGTLTRTSHQGANKVAFSGRIGSRALSPGSYQATLTAIDAAKNTSKPKTLTFAIVKR